MYFTIKYFFDNLKKASVHRLKNYQAEIIADAIVILFNMIIALHFKHKSKNAITALFIYFFCYRCICFKKGKKS